MQHSYQVEVLFLGVKQRTFDLIAKDALEACNIAEKAIKPKSFGYEYVARKQNSIKGFLAKYINSQVVLVRGLTESESFLGWSNEKLSIYCALDGYKNLHYFKGEDVSSFGYDQRGKPYLVVK